MIIILTKTFLSCWVKRFTVLILFTITDSSLLLQYSLSIILPVLIPYAFVWSISFAALNWPNKESIGRSSNTFNLIVNSLYSANSGPFYKCNGKHLDFFCGKEKAWLQQNINRRHGCKGRTNTFVKKLPDIPILFAQKLQAVIPCTVCLIECMYCVIL